MNRMSPFERLHDELPGFDRVPPGLPLVAALTGFRDAGGVVHQVSDVLLDVEQQETVVAFDADVLIDYRARRPTVLIDAGRIQALTMPRLDIRLLRDELGAPFLFLSGHEPDYRWEQFADEVAALAAALQVSTTTWIHSMPMPVPHTRPIRISATGNRTELVEAISVWSPTTEGPAHALHLVEHRLAERGHPVAGLVMLVPHYVADAPVPGAGLAALAAIGTATDLMLPTETLREKERDFVRRVDEQVAESEEVQRLIEALERQHDAYLESLPQGGGLADANGELPSADEIAAELERFLAVRGRHEAEEGRDGRDGRGDGPGRTNRPWGLDDDERR